MRIIWMGMVAALVASPVWAERISHRYDMSVAGIRLASAAIAGEVTPEGYALAARVEARGLAGFFAGDLDAQARGRRSGQVFTPARFEQESEERDGPERLVLGYVQGVPVSADYTPARGPDEKPIPPLGRQGGTVDYLTAILTLTFPGTPEEICARRVDAFTFTKRTRIVGEGVVMQGGVPTCRVSYRDVDPETLVPDDDVDSYTLTLRPLGDGRHEVAEISGPTEFGRARITRTD
ncbi:hypothetical protein [Roseobacter sp. HKCCA0434]|uniref:hypothetical protein n=1 Tax=Roseobacter sp. HKCCA0434 TaxID=3079297 RepID=UPI002905F764|nr:hypothetical protein [Roseobacter sp. HKCCA0434]